jgi:hypothetical protein
MKIDDNSRRNAVEDPAVVLGGFHHGPNIWKTHAVSSSSCQLSGYRLLAPTFRCCSALIADSAFVTLVYIDALLFLERIPFFLCLFGLQT